MNNVFTIIKSTLVPDVYDKFWEDISSINMPNNASSVLVLCSLFSSGSAEEQQLQKMMAACKLDASQFTVFYINEDKVIAWHKLKEKYSPKIVFLFGIHPKQLGISSLFMLNGPNHFSECIWLPTLSLNNLENNKEAKRHLWENAMKPVFIDTKFGGI